MKNLILIWIIVLILYLPIAFSSNVVLQQNNTENLADVSAWSNLPDTNRGTDTTVNIRDHTTDLMRMYLMFNISIIPSGSPIEEAYLGVYQNYPEAAITVRAYEVNSTWGELLLTHNNQPCGTTFGNADNCNLTFESSVVIDPIGVYVWNVTRMVRRAFAGNRGNISIALKTPETGGTSGNTLATKEFMTDITKRPFLNITYIAPADTNPPEITFYNMTSEGGAGCTNWNTSKTNACLTSDTTPTVEIITNKIADCAIGISDLNYTGLGNNRTCSGSGTTEHTCTLINQDALTIETSYLYIGCKDMSGRENQTSTSGALKVTLSTSDAETSARNAIEAGVRQALSGYTIYTAQRVYIRNVANNQATGIFDKVVKWMNKVWAFNYLTENQTAVGMFNITPVFYILEMKNLSFGDINNTVSQLILDTK